MTTDDRFIEAAANTARQLDEWRARAEKLEAERDAAVARYDDFRAAYTSEREAIADEETAAVTRDLAAAQAEIVELKDKLAGRDEYNHELKLAKNAAQAREREWREIARVLQVEGVECLGRPDRCDKLARCGFCLLCAALSAPQDDSSLREFGLKVAQAWQQALLAQTPYSPDIEAIVDAVLKGAE